MAQFNLNDYETVEERLRRFWANPNSQDARLITINHTTPQDRVVGTWVVEARLYLTAKDQEKDLPKTTGWAFEVDGGTGANKTAALENAETSALGRCLANYIFSGNKRTSREEMEKVARGNERIQKDWLKLAKDMTGDIDGLRLLYSEAKSATASQAILTEIEKLATNGPASNEDPNKLNG